MHMSASDEPAEQMAGWESHPASASKFRHQLRPAILGVVVLTLITGCVFPLLLFAVALPLFARQAHGTLVTIGGEVVGSELLGRSSRTF